jgi:hypothetical protein
MVKPRELNKLVKIRTILEDTLDYFPKGNCDAASLILSTIFKWEEWNGYVNSENGVESSMQEDNAHQWAVNPKTNEDVDISLDQFEGFDIPIYVSPRNNNLLVGAKLTDTIDKRSKLLSEPDVWVAFDRCYNQAGLNFLEKRRIMNLRSNYFRATSDEYIADRKEAIEALEIKS